jgi:hypothetical protein
VGTITVSPVTIAGGSYAGLTQFQPHAEGSTLLSAAGPAGFTVPAQNASLTATVISSALSVADVVVGRNLQQITTVFLGGVAPAGGVPVTLTSGNPSLVQLAAGATDPGAASITITIPEGMGMAYFYVRALADSGTVSFTATASAYLGDTATATLAPSGVIAVGNYNTIQYVFMTGDFSPMTVRTCLLDPATHTFVQEQELAGGLSLAVALTNDDPSVGAIATPVTITGGTDRAEAPFSPLKTGMTFIRVTTPPGYTTPFNRTTVTVQVM